MPGVTAERKFPAPGYRMEEKMSSRDLGNPLWAPSTHRSPEAV
jgi:hypothetical protein